METIIKFWKMPSAGMATSTISGYCVFMPAMKMQYPEIVDVAMPAEGIFQNLMIVSIRKSYPGQARKIMNAIWSLGQAMFTKVVVVVDHDVDVQNSSEVVWKALCAIDPERDIQFVLGVDGA